jgi:hypothetical protein
MSSSPDFRLEHGELRGEYEFTGFANAHADPTP